jgi:CrcB protein
MRNILSLAAGGAIGCVLRYVLTKSIQSKVIGAFPYGTLCVNIVGCLIIGILFGLAERANLSTGWRLFLATGICGSFTTFSAFSIESVAMMREGNFMLSFGYIILSIVFGLLATFAGLFLIKAI